MLDGCCYFLLGLGCHCRLVPHSLGPGDEGMGLLDLVGVGTPKVAGYKKCSNPGNGPWEWAGDLVCGGLQGLTCFAAPLRWPVCSQRLPVCRLANCGAFCMEESAQSLGLSSCLGFTTCQLHLSVLVSG